MKENAVLKRQATIIPRFRGRSTNWHDKEDKTLKEILLDLVLAVIAAAVPVITAHAVGYIKKAKEKAVASTDKRCKALLDRDFMSFCDRCGQKLSWKNYKKARRVYSGMKNK